MSLRLRTLLAMASALALLLAALYGGVSWLVGRGFDEVERRAVQDDVHRVLDQIDEQVTKLDFTVNDWAAWDDTYAFIVDRNEAYQSSNLTDATILRLKLHAIAYLGPAGEPVFARGADAAFTAVGPLDPALQAQLAPSSPWLQTAADGGRRGVIGMPQGLLLVAARPIVTSQGEGPVRGTLLFGRYLDAGVTQEISAKLRVSFTLHQLAPGAALSTALQPRVQALASQGPGAALAEPLDGRRMAGFALVRDAQGRPAALIDAVLPRPIFQQAGNTRQYVLGAMVALGLLLGALALWLLEQLVLARLSRLAHRARQIGETRTAQERLPVDSRDELGRLAERINEMLDRLAQAQQDMAEHLTRQRAMLHALPDILYRVSAAGRCLDAQGSGAQARTALIGRPVEELWPSGAAAVRQAMQQALATGQMQLCEQRRPGPAGEEIFEVRVVPSSGAELFLLERNVTLRARYEEALRREKAALGQLQDSTQQEKSQLEEMNRIMVGREERMVQLKQEVNGLLTELGRPARY